eukprot:2867804-Amphidinium_carterae.1
MADATRLADHREQLHHALMEYGWLGLIASPDLLAHPNEVLAQPDVQQRALQDAVEGFECHWPCGQDGAVCGAQSTRDTLHQSTWL